MFRKEKGETDDEEDDDEKEEVSQEEKDQKGERLCILKIMILLMK